MKTEETPATLLGGRRWLVALLVVAAIALMQALPSLMAGRDTARAVTRLAYWLVQTPAQFAVLTYTFGCAARRQLSTTRTVAASLLVSGLLGGVTSTIFRFVWRDLLELNPGRDTPLGLAVGFGVALGLMSCGIWALSVVYPYAAEQARLRAVEAEKLRLEAEKLRTAAELARLRSQLEPHFLLNTLNAISGLVTQEPREARRLIAALGELLRDSLDDAELQTLEQEIAWLKRYAQILQSRHAGALEFQWEVDDEARSAIVPRLLLQPLVENAVQHGALRRGKGGKVVVRVRVTGEGAVQRVVCSIEDNGPGDGDEAPRSGAFGLRAVRRRLELKYPDAELRLESSEDGTRSIVDIPRTVVDPTATPHHA